MKFRLGELADAEIARAGRTLAILGLEGAALSFFLQASVRSQWLAGFVAKNELGFHARLRLLGALAVGALAVALPALLLLARRGSEMLDRLESLSRRCAPALVLWALPPLLTWEAWRDQDFIFLLSAAVMVLATERATRVSLAAFGPPAPGSWRGRLLDRLRALPAALTGRGPHVVVAVAVASYIVYFSHFSIVQHHLLATASFDLGYFDNLFWNAMHGRPFYAPVPHPRDGSYLSIHAEFALYPLLPFYMLRPGPETLLIMQSALCGLAAVPLYLFARRRLANDALAALIAVAYLLYPGLHGPNLCDFHFLTLSAFFILWAVYFFDSRRWIPFWIAVVMCLLCREDVPFGIIAAGVGLLLSGAAVRTGAVLAVLGTVYVLVVKFVIMARYGTSFLYIYEGLVPPGEHGFGAVVKTLATNPPFVFASLFTMPKAIFFLQVMVPVAFLPLRRRGLWFLLFPGFFVTLLSTGYWPITNLGFQYVTHFTPYVFVAAVLVLERIGREKDGWARLAATAAMAFGTVVVTHHYGALQQDHFFTGGSQRRFTVTAEEKERLENLRSIIATIPADGSVAATENDGPHLARRTYLFTLKYSAQDADYLLYSYWNIDFGEARRIVRDALNQGTYGLHAERPGYVVLRKGAPTTRNQELLGKL